MSDLEERIQTYWDIGTAYRVGSEDPPTIDDVIGDLCDIIETTNPDAPLATHVQTLINQIVHGSS